jgi:hypothetical protein
MPDQHALADRTDLDALRSARLEPTAETLDRSSQRGGLGVAGFGLAADPRLAMGASAVPILHSLQRQVGNRAVVERLGVQRQGLEDFGLGDPGFGGGGGPTDTGSGGGTQVISGDVIELNAGSIVLNAPLTRVNGVLQSDTLVTDSVIASTYTPGAGNVF